MAFHFYHYILFHLSIIIPFIQCQNTSNTSNTTISPITTSFQTTIFQTTIEPSLSPTTSIPSSSPTITTFNPTLSPTYKGCTAIHGYVETTLTTIGMNGQINSYPVQYGPQVYRIYNRSIAVFPAPKDSEPNPCNISLFNRQDIVNKVVLIDGTLYDSHNICNYQQWTLNFQSLGAKALLIGANVFNKYYLGDESLDNPRIPTRFIHSTNVYTITNEVCGINNYNCNPIVKDIRITMDCNNNTAPEWICIEDGEYGRDDYFRMNGPYSQLIGNDQNGHPVWQQDATYNIDSTINWKIYFDVNDYFNWVIGEGPPNNPPVNAYCNDTITDDPTNCSVWYKRNKQGGYYEMAESIIIMDDYCPTPNENKNTTFYCIQSQSNYMIDFSGTYSQLIEGIPEWFYEASNGGVSVLYWDEFLIPLGDTCYGWKIKTNNDIAYCCYSNSDLSFNNGLIRFEPYLCNQWFYDSITQQIDNTFDIDQNRCENNVNSHVNMICISYNNSLWSGVYQIINGTFQYNHRIWNNNNLYFILYYEITDAWIIIANDYTNINTNNIIANCSDKNGIYSNPILCTNWILNNSNIVMNSITDIYDCESIIISTTQSVTVTVTNNAGSDGESKNGLSEFGLIEYIAIGAALLAFPLCIVCFVCYQKRKSKQAHSTNDQGISLQPYVPTGMAYDSYKQNKSHQLAQKAAEKQKQMKSKSKSLRAAAPTSVASTSAHVDANNNNSGDTTAGESVTIDSTNGLLGDNNNNSINVFDEDDAIQIDDDEPTMGRNNPFLTDGIIRTGQTIDETMQQKIDVKDIMSAFDE